MKQYLDRRWSAISVVLAILAGLSIPFNTWSYAQFFSLMTQPRVNVRTVWLTVALIAGVTILFAVIDYGYQRALNRNVALFNQHVREYLLTSDFIETDQSNVSARLSYLTNDLDVIENNDLRQVFTMIRAVVTVVFTLALAIHNNFGLTLIFIAFASVTPFTPKLLARRTKQRAQNWSSRVGRYMTFMSDVLRNAATVRHYAALGLFLQKGRGIIHASVTAKRRRDNTVAASNLVAAVVAYVCMYVPIGFGVVLVIQGHLTVASFVTVQYASNWIINSFLTIAQSRSQMNATQPMLTQLAQFKPLPDTSLQSDWLAAGDDAFAALQLTQVAFAYPDDPHQPVLRGVDLRIKRGDKVLLTGPSGVGKSTLIHILMGTLPPTSGTAAFRKTGGQDVQPTPEMFSEVRQESNIFNDTLRFNLTLGRSFSDQQITAALRQAGLLAYAQEHGLDTLITENGDNLSGGEHKRIELARAFLYQRQFLVVDEGTASLDPQTADDIQRIILASPATVVEIDHHLSAALRRKFNAHYELSQGKLTLMTEGNE